MTDPLTPAERSDSEAVFHFRANEVPIKALEWSRPYEHDTLTKAHTIIGTYDVVRQAGEWRWSLEGPVMTNKYALSEADAHSAAQTDFERRIRSAIRQPTETELLQLAARIYGLPELVEAPKANVQCPKCGGSGDFEEPNPFFNADDDDSAEDEFVKVACTACSGAGKLDLGLCPHCNSGDTFIERDGYSSAYVTCNDCGCRGPVCEADNGDRTDEIPGGIEAIAAWNRRPPADAEKALKK